MFFWGLPAIAVIWCIPSMPGFFLFSIICRYTVYGYTCQTIKTCSLQNLTFFILIPRAQFFDGNPFCLCKRGAITMRNPVFTHFLCNVAVAINAIGMHEKDHKKQEFVLSSQKYLNKQIDNGTPKAWWWWWFFLYYDGVSHSAATAKTFFTVHINSILPLQWIVYRI